MQNTCKNSVTRYTLAHLQSLTCSIQQTIKTFMSHPFTAKYFKNAACVQIHRSDMSVIVC